MTMQKEAAAYEVKLLAKLVTVYQFQSKTFAPKGVCVGGGWWGRGEGGLQPPAPYSTALAFVEYRT